MTCAGCENHIERELIKVPGVEGVKVSHETGEAVVYVSEAALQTEELLLAVKRAGYTANPK